MNKFIATLIVSLSMLIPIGIANSAQAQSRCGKYHGRDYIICKESGANNLPYGLPPGTPHRGPSSASGPCGMLAETRRIYGGDSLAACTRYVVDRYGSWEDAEMWHRSHNWF